MAIFRLSNKHKKAKDTQKIKRNVGIGLLFVSSVLFLFSVSTIWPALQAVILGIFGVAIYPLTVVTMVIAIALMNNRKYVMSKRYAITLALSVVFLVALFQLIIVGDNVASDGVTRLSYFEYLALNYSKTWTAGGFIIGILTSTLVVPLNLAAAYIIVLLGLVISVALFAESLVSYYRTGEVESPVKIQFKEHKKLGRGKEKAEKSHSSGVNVVLDGEIEENLSRENVEVKPNPVLSPMSNSGLQGSGRQAQWQSGQSAYKEPQVEQSAVCSEKMDAKSLKSFLLTPPQVDMDEFRARTMRNRPRESQQIITPTPEAKAEAESTFSQMKNEQILPAQNIIEQQYSAPEQQTYRRGNLPEIKAEDLVRQVDEMTKEAAFEELEQMSADTPESEKKPLDSDEFFRDLSTLSEGEQGSRENLTRENLGRENLTGENLRENLSRDSLGRENLRENLTRDSLGRDSLSRENLGDSLNRDSLNRDSLSRENLTRENLGRESLGRENLRENLGREGLSRENLGNANREERRASLLQSGLDPTRAKVLDAEGDKKSKKEKITSYKYAKPSIDLITTRSDDLSLLNDEVPAKRVALENALEKFGVPAKVQSVVIGPTVTRYEIAMPEGISVKKILSLDADIAYALSARGQIRIEAPVPGRSVVGIEVPNSKVAKVSIKDVLMSKEFSMSPSPLTFALGKDISGNVKVCNLQKMPHLLVAGTTGSGKSVCLNSIIISILYKASPDDVKFIMIDPKQVELSMYEGLPHMVVPKVITDATKAVNALGWAVEEMERRFNLISDARVRNIDEYNKTEEVLRGEKKKLPFLVIIFDEFADFMLVAKNEIDEKIMRLAQKARAAGIHLILATQRPSADVVTGTIKANFPARIAFKVASRVDSEVILGSPGAEKLLGYGDMLYKPSDSSAARLQGCFIDTPETKDIVNFIIENNEETCDDEALAAINGSGKTTSSQGDSEMDPLLPQALKVCIDVGVASTTMVQRKLSIGYPRAARIIDQMEQRGYISSAEGSKQRTVYISIEEFYKIFGDNFE